MNRMCLQNTRVLSDAVPRAGIRCPVGAIGQTPAPRWGGEGVVRRAAVPFGLEACHTDAAFSTLTRRVIGESFL